MKISLITVAYNSASTIGTTLDSVAKQCYPNIEHIIVDGNSRDETLEIVARYPHVARVISEPDQGIYDAMNKGIQAATGDYVGTLNSDDFFPNPGVVSRIVESLHKGESDVLIADILFVSRKNLDKPIRYYSAGRWSPAHFAWGFMPPHPSFYVKREHYERLGLYRTDYAIAADFELMIRYLHTHRLKYTYLPEPLVFMQAGGISNRALKSRWLLNREIVRACCENGLRTNLLKVSLKYLIKIFEYLPGTKSRFHAS